MSTINDILLRTSLLFLWGTSVLGVIVGILMLVRPATIERINLLASRWIDTDRVEVAIDKPRWTERFFYRYHKVTGAFFLLGGVLVLYTFMFSASVKKLAIVLSRDSQWLASGLISALIIGAVVSAFIGLMLFLRPSMLRDVERHSNRWVSTDNLLHFFNETHSEVDKFIVAHRKLMGILLFVGSTYIVFVLGHYLWWTKNAVV